VVVAARAAVCPLRYGGRRLAFTGRCVLLTPVARICDEGPGHLSCAGDGALQHGHQVFHVGRLIADAHRQDHLVVAVDDRLAVAALQHGAIALHDVAVGIWVAAGPRSGSSAGPWRKGIGPMGQAAMGHGMCWLALQPLRFKAGHDRQLLGGFCSLLRPGRLVA